ncbi:MAG: class I SAM-dependent methyltransferase [Pseudomonadota bacterium]
MLALDFIKKKSVGVEIGVHKGVFSSQILRHVRPASLTLVDPWKHMDDSAYERSHYGGERIDQAGMDQRYQQVLKRFGKQMGEGVVKVIRSDSAGAAKEFEDGSLDFVYIDGDHSYEAVKSDLALYYPKVKKGGLIIGDDYEDGRWWKDDVIRAFHEFIAANPVQIEFKLGVQIGVRV